MHSRIRLALVVSMTLMLGACFGELDEDGDRRTADDGSPSGENQAPTIAGTPPTHVVEGEFYEFMPSATDADGDTLEFTITRKPSWASFDPTTGRLWGTPDAEDVGNFTNVAITVSDGSAAAALTAFDISVEQIALGSATLSWTPPTENADGSVLTDLSGYRIYYGRNRDNLNQVITLGNPGLTRYVVENLVSAVWYFSMTSVNAEGAESNRSTIASKTIS